jgi:phosphatidylinositol dimannoside acyltransferase
LAQRIQPIKQLELNLARVLNCDVSDPRIRPLSLETMQSYMRYYCETFMLPRWTDEQLFGKVRTEGSEQVLDALKTGGVVLALPHLANWDWAGAWAARSFWFAVHGCRAITARRCISKIPKS